MRAVGEPRVGLGKDRGRPRPDDEGEDDEPAPVEPDPDPGDPADREAVLHGAYGRLRASRTTAPTRRATTGPCFRTVFCADCMSFRRRSGGIRFQPRRAFTATRSSFIAAILIPSSLVRLL